MMWSFETGFFFFFTAHNVFEFTHVVESIHGWSSSLLCGVPLHGCNLVFSPPTDGYLGCFQSGHCEYYCLVSLLQVTLWPSASGPFGEILGAELPAHVLTVCLVTTLRTLPSTV